MSHKIGAGQSAPVLPSSLDSLPSSQTSSSQTPSSIASAQAVQGLTQEPLAPVAQEPVGPSALQEVDVALARSRPAMAGQSVLGLLGQSEVVDAQSAEHLFGLIPGRTPGAVGLDTVLDAIPDTPAGEQAVRSLVEMIQAHTGLPVEPAMLDAILAKPSRIANLLKLSPAELGRGIEALNLRHQTEGGEAASSSKLELPSRLDLAKLAELPIERPEAELKEVGPGLLRGDRKSDLGDDQAKTNIAMASVFDRLAANPTAAENEQFAVDYNGQSYDRLDTFLQALRDDGHEVEVAVKQRIANFAGLHTQAPDGTLLDVPAPLFVKTGVRDESGEEAVVPSVHSELVIRVRQGDDTQGPGVDADIRWFQGISGTGFFPDGLFREPAWAGGTERTIGTGDKAMEAIQLAGLMSDTINDSASAQDLWLGGYGVTGVCNDSVAVIEHATTGRNLTYPLMMQDEVLMPELEERLRNDGPDRGRYEKILHSIETLPNDRDADASVRERALHSLPWTPGLDPFQSAEDARLILQP